MEYKDSNPLPLLTLRICSFPQLNQLLIKLIKYLVRNHSTAAEKKSLNNSDQYSTVCTYVHFMRHNILMPSIKLFLH